MQLNPDSSADKRQIEALRLDKTREASILVRELLAERLRVISEAGTATEANLFTSIGRRCLTTHKSIWEIAKPKYIAEMNILLRPLAEAVIIACYLQIAPPSEAANYLHFDKIAIHRQAEKFNALCSDPMTEAMKKTHIGMKDDADQAQALIGRNPKKLGWSDVSVFNRARAIDDWLSDQI